jgi:sodium-dependent phosphate cotransporter
MPTGSLRVKKSGSRMSPTAVALRWASLFLFLYAFLVSIGVLSAAFGLMGEGFVHSLFDSASNPVVGLFVGILATTLAQSSSTTTSVVVALVGGGTMDVSTAIPVIMGANIGTSVTNTLVSLGHIRREDEFYRAFSASTVHDFFNILAVAILFPIQVATDFLGILATGAANLLADVGGLTFTSPLKTLTAPVVKAFVALFADHPVLLLLASLALMFAMLHRLVVTLKALVVSKAESFFDQSVFRNAFRGMMLGLLLTVLVQSSSITTSLVVPLAGAGILSLRQIFPYTLGANVGTTVTAILASLAVGELTAVTVALSHLFFNVIGIATIWPLPSIRRLPIRLSRAMARASIRNRWIPVAYILIGFYFLPFVVIIALR